MRTIWKSQFRPNSSFASTYDVTIKAKTGAKPISVGVQNGSCVVWFECNEEASAADFTLYCVGTGFGEVPEGKRFLGTIAETGYVWHIYCDA